MFSTLERAVAILARTHEAQKSLIIVTLHQKLLEIEQEKNDRFSAHAPRRPGEKITHGKSVLEALCSEHTSFSS